MKVRQIKLEYQISPYFSLEKYIFNSHGEYQDMFVEDVFVEQWNMLAAGIHCQKSIFFSSLSLAGLWRDQKSQLLPVFDVNLGININNGYFSSLLGKKDCPFFSHS